jgi:hypothetical protein
LGEDMGIKIQLAISLWITSLAALWGVSYAFMQSPATSGSPCQTLVTDPQPPLNVRSSPIVATDNVVGSVGNGTLLKVARQQDGWLQVQAPVAGWVAAAMTTTTCSGRNQSLQATVPRSSHLRAVSLQIIDKAQDQFQAGHLQAAKTMLQTIPASDFHYSQAQAALQTMTHQWQQGDRAYRSAQTALQKGHWQVLASVNEAPDVQYWRSKMAPIVKRAIHQQAQR